MSRTSAAREPARVVTGDPAAILPPFFRSGEVAEWLKAHAWKACIRETVSWVRIPPSPPVHRLWSSIHVRLPSISPRK